MALHNTNARFLFLSLLCLVAAVVDIASAQVLLPFSRQSAHSLVAGPNSKRASSDEVSLASSDYVYVVNATVGTPGQAVSLIISPSTADTWVPDANSEYCDPNYYTSSYRDAQDTALAYCKWGSYNQTLSSTYLTANQQYLTFRNYYPDGSTVLGTNFTDKLVVGDIELDNYPMGLVSSSYQAIGMLGLGYNTSSYGYSSSYGSYGNLPDRLVAQGKISSKAYSIWLDDPEGRSGNLLLGAIDTSRFDGTLVRVDGYNSYAYGDTFGVSLAGINITSSDGSAVEAIQSNDFPTGLTISPAETFSFLPQTLSGKIMSVAGATYNQTLGQAVISCDAGKTNNAQFAFQLSGSGGPVLNVHVSDLVVSPAVYEMYYNLYDSSGAYYSTTPDTILPSNVCLFGIQNVSSYSSSSYSTSSGSDYYNLGSSILRRSYAVFDLVNREVAIAPTRFTTDKATPTVVAFESLGATVPSASLYCTDSSCSTYCGSLGYSTSDCPTTSGTSGSSGRTGSSSSPDDEDSGQLSVILGVGISFGILALIAAIAGVVVWKRVCWGKRKYTPAKEFDEEDGVDPANTVPQMQQQPPTMTGGSGTQVRATPMPSISEEEMAEAQSQHTQAPQLPALPSHLAGSLTPPEPNSTPPPARDADTISALSADEQATAPTEPAHAPPFPPSEPQPVSAPVPVPQAATSEEEPGPRSPKGKGKEVAEP
ncbi:aspartic peptidase domain-containing protein [Diplogelasinospora grovesii]|uniref:Aspartic peptidase domain-containing protein n=1 Tax=Diplogelasinospora grovesii TaxID=303347 RepID=A0AAN6S4G8_9PEZI|nr:aspartic peptidase domain-containing protein [Diplogelasinospora grovesii]